MNSQPRNSDPLAGRIVVKAVNVTFKDGKHREIEYINAGGTPAGFIVFDLSNGDSVHLNLDCVESMEFSGLERTKGVILTQ